jgi:hypothetical protein
VGHRLLDWSFYALILMCPVILYILFGSVFKAHLERLVSDVGELVCWFAPVSRKRKKKKCLHCKRRARGRARVKKFWRQALSVALVVLCRRRSSNKPSTLKHLGSTSTTSEPVRWKWRKRMVGLDSVIPRLESSTIDSFCEAEQDFLRLPQLLCTLCNHDYHAKQLKLALDRVALLRGYEMHQLVPDHLDPKFLILIWDTGGSAGSTPFCSNFINYVEYDIDIRDVMKVNKVIGIGTTLHKFVDVAGNNVYLPCVSYHLPSTDIRLFSPQVYHQTYGGHSVVDGN